MTLGVENIAININCNIKKTLSASYFGCSLKNARQRMEPWGTRTLTGYFFEDLQPEVAIYKIITKWDQKPDLKFHKIWDSEEDQHELG